MKTIIKTDAHQCLQRAVDEGWNWDDFHRNAHDDYVLVREQALSDQGNECAYTGLWLGDGTSQKVHIDHFRKKALYPEHTFCWTNLFAAAKDLDYGSDCKDENIRGPRANADSQYHSFWSPFEANLNEAFWYRQDGKIEPDPNLSEDAKLFAQRTIDMYNLNAADLKRRRVEVIRNVRSLQQFEDELIRVSMDRAGFSFVVEFELKNRVVK
ncbi:MULTISPECIES: retron system putative HNH endonuclease [Butyricimonas]|uniref:retron system putative HNH endonuclease n=1 Tax=Butyricimonas TaxID=574697 RepID=UPI0007FB293C|nr:MULTISPECIES: retron system putative HNH endonuclease [Butyricimonas]